MIFIREGKTIWETVDWEKPNETRRLGNNTLECIREGNKKEERKKAIEKKITED